MKKLETEKLRGWKEKTVEKKKSRRRKGEGGGLQTKTIAKEMEWRESAPNGTVLENGKSMTGGK